MCFSLIFTHFSEVTILQRIRSRRNINYPMTHIQRWGITSNNHLSSRTQSPTLAKYIVHIPYLPHSRNQTLNKQSKYKPARLVPIIQWKMYIMYAYMQHRTLTYHGCLFPGRPHRQIRHRSTVRRLRYRSDCCCRPTTRHCDATADGWRTQMWQRMTRSRLAAGRTAGVARTTWMLGDLQRK